MENKMLKAALIWGHKGFEIFPVASVKDGICACYKGKDCASPGKHPLIKDWQKKATKNSNKIRQFWVQYPNANIGIKTGNGIVVVDIDVKDDGLKSFEAEENKHPKEKTLRITTGSGGGHNYFRDNTNSLKNKTRFMQGVDLRANGGFIVAPPSTHLSGQKYKIVDTGTENAKDLHLAELPNWLREIINSKKNILPRKAASSLRDGREGSRNSYLASEAGKLRAKGLNEKEIRDHLFNINSEKCEPPLLEDEVVQIAKSIARYQDKPLKIDWPQIDLSAYSKFQHMQDISKDILLSPYLEFAEGHAMASGLPLAAIVVPTITTISALLGSAFKIKPSQHSSHSVYLNLWGVVIAPSGSRKTSALKTAFKLSEAVDQDFEKERLEKEKELRNKKVFLKSDIDRLKNKKNKTDSEFVDLKNKNSEYEESLSEALPNWSFTTSDSTPESMGLLFKDNHRGIFYLRDELDGLFQLFNKQSYETMRSMLNEAWNGGSPFRFTRISRGIITIPSTTVSILGGVQPDILRKVFNDEISKGNSSDGLLARFQLLCCFDIKDLKKPNSQISLNKPNAKMVELVQKIHLLTKKYNLNSAVESEPLYLSNKAEKLYERFQAGLHDRLCSSEIESSAYRSHITKYSRFVLALAAQLHIIHCISSNKTVTPEISDIHFFNAENLVKYFDYQAQRVYGLVEFENSEKILAQKILTGRVKNGDSVRAIYKKGWSGLSTKDAVLGALESLGRIGWVNVYLHYPEGGGHYTELVQLHPDLAYLQSLQAPTDKTDDTILATT